MNDRPTNIVIAGLGGQGVIKCSDVAVQALFKGGFDVKKSEIHGMSQRGGSVASDIRFGRKVWSPMVPAGEADYLVVLSPEQVPNNVHVLKESGVLLVAYEERVAALRNKKAANIALLGALSNYLPLSDELWLESIAELFPPQLKEQNAEAFAAGKLWDGTKRN